MKAQVMQYLRALAPNTRVAVYALGSNLRILHDFTDDLEALRARLAKHNIEFNIQPISADELVRRQLMEAEHFNDAVDEYDRRRRRRGGAEPTPKRRRSSTKCAAHGEGRRSTFRNSFTCAA